MTTNFTEEIQRAMEPLVRRYRLRTCTELEEPMMSEILYANNTTAVRVTVDWMEFRPFIRLYQLEKGRLPLPANAAYSLGKSMKDFDVDLLLSLRISDSPVIMRSFSKSGKEEVRISSGSPVGKMFSERSQSGISPLLVAYATAMDQYASDVLNGDFEVFPILNNEVRRRICNDPV
jgi:hypothetical protein